MELWRNITSSTRHAVRFATETEAAGYDGIGVTDSQNLAGDCWVALTAMAMSTTTLKLATGVTNPVTRHPAVTASAAHALNILSPAPDGSGRVVVGIGRGDSALAHLGRAPASVRTLERYLVALRGYLTGAGVEFDDLGFHEAAAPDVATLGLSDTPDRSELRWRRGTDPVVPVEVTASGPRVIAAAARSSDRVLLVIGADLDRLRWGIELARQARLDAGLDPDALAVGAYIQVVPHPDVEVARTMAEGSLTTLARFSVMHGTVNGPTTPAQARVFEQLHASYNMTQHTRVGSDQAGVLTPGFIDDFAAVGPVEACAEKLRAIAGLGIDKVVLSGPSSGSDKAEAARSNQLVADQLIPMLKETP